MELIKGLLGLIGACMIFIVLANVIGFAFAVASALLPFVLGAIGIGIAGMILYELGVVIKGYIADKRKR